MPAQGVQFQNLSFRQAIRRAPETERVLDAVPFDTIFSATFLNPVQEPADVDRKSQVRLDQFFHHFLQGVEVCKDGICSRAILLVGNQLLNVNVVLENVALLAIANIDGMIFQADSYKLLKLAGRSLPVDSF